MGRGLIFVAEVCVWVGVRVVVRGAGGGDSGRG